MGYLERAHDFTCNCSPSDNTISLCQNLPHAVMSSISWAYYACASNNICIFPIIICWGSIYLGLHDRVLLYSLLSWNFWATRDDTCMQMKWVGFWKLASCLKCSCDDVHQHLLHWLTLYVKFKDFRAVCSYLVLFSHDWNFGQSYHIRLVRWWMLPRLSFAAVHVA
jgi:hypothetical protein